jgi:hypothetical protein
MIPPAAWHHAGLVRLARVYLTEVADTKMAAAHQRHRHETVWMLLELTASDVEGTVTLASELAKEIGPLLIAYVEGADTVMVQLCSHALANMLACSSAIPPLLGSMGAAAALGKQLQRLPSSVAAAAMWAIRQFLALPTISHAAILADAIPAIQFWLAKAHKAAAASSADPAAAAAAATASGGSAGGASPADATAGSSTQSATVEACVLLSVIGSGCHEAWLQLADPAHPVVPTACAVLCCSALSPALRAPLLEALAVLSAQVDVGPQVLSQPDMLQALLAMAAANAPVLDAAGRPTGAGLSMAAASARAAAAKGFSSDEIRGISATSIPYLSMVLIANLVSPGSPQVAGQLESRRTQLIARKVTATLPTIDQLIALTQAPGRPSQAEVAGTLVRAGAAHTCCRWLHSTYRMRYQALCALSSLALAGLADPHPPAPTPAPAGSLASAAASGPSLPHLAPVMALPGVLSMCVDSLREHRDIASVGTSLGLLGHWLHSVPPAAETFEAAGGRQAIDAMIYSGQCTDVGPGSFSPWGALAAEARSIVDRFLEADGDDDGAGDFDDDDDEHEGGGGGGEPAAAAAGGGVGRGRPNVPARWHVASPGVVPGASAAPAGAMAAQPAANPFAGLG